MIHNMKNNKDGNDGNCALKIDISKVYDMVQWDFLMGMLLCFGFALQWVNWLAMCFFEVTYHININGEWIGPIVPSRGLRQKDLISPYLYLACAEGLSLLFKDVETKGWLQGCRASAKCPRISTCSLQMTPCCFLMLDWRKQTEVNQFLPLIQFPRGKWLILTNPVLFLVLVWFLM